MRKAKKDPPPDTPLSSGEAEQLMQKLSEYREFLIGRTDPTDESAQQALASKLKDIEALQTELEIHATVKTADKARAILWHGL
jgi:hypothetical protein